jgi:uncharacterized OB-fold protein
MNPAAYWRANKKWTAWLGQVGTVVAATQIRVSAPGLSEFTPYSYLIVEFTDPTAPAKRKELMGVTGQVLVSGDQVKCVLRKISIPDDRGVIPYGIKVEKIVEGPSRS